MTSSGKPKIGHRFFTLIAGLTSSLWALNVSAGPSAEFIDRLTLAPCPTSPNCVSSLALEQDHAINPLALAGSIAAQKASILKVVESLPGTRIKEQTSHYIWMTFTTRIMRYVDDVEFLLVEGKPVEIRSASRVGYSDLGTNRRRVERIRAALHQ